MNHDAGPCRSSSCQDLVKKPLESDTSAEISRYFQIRKKWDNHEYVVPVTEDLEFLNMARQRFPGDCFDSLYHEWRSGELGEEALRAGFSRLRPERSVFFVSYLVRSHPRPVDLERKIGERCVKDGDHQPVHHSVHPAGERKLLGA